LGKANACSACVALACSLNVACALALLFLMLVQTTLANVAASSFVWHSLFNVGKQYKSCRCLNSFKCQRSMSKRNNFSGVSALQTALFKHLSHWVWPNWSVKLTPKSFAFWFPPVAALLAAPAYLGR
jgi:hypothetical protein